MNVNLNMIVVAAERVIMEYEIEELKEKVLNSTDGMPPPIRAVMLNDQLKNYMVFAKKRLELIASGNSHPRLKR